MECCGNSRKLRGGPLLKVRLDFRSHSQEVKFVHLTSILRTPVIFFFLTSDENFLIRKDPVEMCGYHPCKVAKCLTTPTTMCVSDSECKPVFFNTNGRIIESCKGKSLKISLDTLVMPYFDRLVVKVLFSEPWYRSCIFKNCVARSVFPDVFICSIIPDATYVYIFILFISGWARGLDNSLTQNGALG